MDDSDPATAASLDELAACLRRVHLLADKPTFRTLEQQTTHTNGLLPGTRLKRTRLTRTTVSDILLGRKFPGKAFLLTFVDACGVDLESDHRWEQAWDRLAPQYQQGPAQAEVDMLRQESAELRQESDELRRKLAAAEGRAAAVDGLRQEGEDLRRKLSAAEHRVGTVAALVEEAIPDDCALPENWQVCAALLPLARAVLADDSYGLVRLAIYLARSGAHSAARDLQQKVLDARLRVLGSEHPDTLDARRIFAHWTGEAGDPAAARNQVAKLLPDFERVLGPDHPDTLNVRRILAHWTGEAGDPAAARNQLAKLLPDFERVLGPDHPDTLDAYRILAHWTGEMGNAAAARNQLAKLLPDFERVLGPDHPDTLNTRHDLTWWTGETGNATAARGRLWAPAQNAPASLPVP